MRLAVVLVLLVATAAPARAHDLRPGILAFVEDAPGELRMRFVPPVDSRGEAQELPIVLPAGCKRGDGDHVRCANGFAGELAIGGMRGHAMKIYVSLERGGERRDWVLTSEAPRITIAPVARPPWPIAQLALFAALVLAGLRPRRLVATTLVVIGIHAAGFSAASLAILVAVATVALARTALVGERRVVGLRAHRAAAYALGALASYGLVRAVAELAGR